MANFKLRTLLVLVSIVGVVLGLLIAASRENHPPNVRKILNRIGGIAPNSSVADILLELEDVAEQTLEPVSRCRDFDNYENYVLHYRISDDYHLRIYAKVDHKSGVERFDFGMILVREFEGVWPKWLALYAKPSKTAKPKWGIAWDRQMEAFEMMDKNQGLNPSANKMGEF